MDITITTFDLCLASQFSAPSALPIHSSLHVTLALYKLFLLTYFHRATPKWLVQVAQMGIAAAGFSSYHPPTSVINRAVELTR